MVLIILKIYVHDYFVFRFEGTIVRDIFRQFYSQWMDWTLFARLDRAVKEEEVKLRGEYVDGNILFTRIGTKRGVEMRQTFRRSRCASATYSLNRW